ncbi:MAG: galactose mutarotase [Dysgonamonadaceae bacterium]|jgi:aldose 1-epimerase|nr:galactose mutarotase [Dysgonamonadaceae bacterium]
MKKLFLTMGILSMLIVSCVKKEQAEQPTGSGLLPSQFEGIYENDSTHLYVMKNAKGMEVCVTNIGGRIVSVLVPDKSGEMRDVVLGFDNIESYKGINTNFGALIGRYGNRIAKGEFTLSNNLKCKLRTNNGANSLHGGPRGFHTQYFNIEQPDSVTLVCSYLSKDMEEGFPGNLQVTVTYRLTDDNALDISYEAMTDQLTVVNLTNHSYFNLSGDPNNTILDHLMFLDCDKFTPTDDELIPTGKLQKVAGTPMDFTTPTAIGARIDDTTFVDLKNGKGYDHNYVLNHPGDLSIPACKVVCPATGIAMSVYTTEPGIQFYAGNFLDGSDTGKKGIPYNHRTALCLETQHFPDSPNQPTFPSVELKPGDVYTSRCIYQFTVE